MATAAPPPILIAVSDPDDVKFFTELLRHVGYDCDAAVDCVTVARLLTEKDYDLLIVDTEMSGNTRLELVRSIHAHQKNLSVIIVTSHPSVETAILACRIPVQEYLEKPVDVTEFLKHVRSAVVRSQICRSVKETRQSVALWLSNVENIMAMLDRPTPNQIVTAAKTLMSTALKNIFGAAASISSLLETMPSADGKDEELAAIKSSRTVCLEATKKSFKSKEIADLRRKLQILLTSET